MKGGPGNPQEALDNLFVHLHNLPPLERHHAFAHMRGEPMQNVSHPQPLTFSQTETSEMNSRVLAYEELGPKRSIRNWSADTCQAIPPSKFCEDSFNHGQILLKVIKKGSKEPSIYLCHNYKGYATLQTDTSLTITGFYTTEAVIFSFDSVGESPTAEFKQKGLKPNRNRI